MSRFYPNGGARLRAICEWQSDWPAIYDVPINKKNVVNISSKNKYYSEYTFHYWLWKNYLDQIDDKWIGFCQYKKFWSLKTYKTGDVNINSLNNQVLKKIPEEYTKYEAILTKPTFVNQWKTMKFIKMGLKIFIKNPFRTSNCFYMRNICLTYYIY